MGTTIFFKALGLALVTVPIVLGSLARRRLPTLLRRGLVFVASACIWHLVAVAPKQSYQHANPQDVTAVTFCNDRGHIEFMATTHAVTLVTTVPRGQD